MILSPLKSNPESFCSSFPHIILSNISLIIKSILSLYDIN